MRAIDTNVLVRLLTRDDPVQAAAADAFVKGGAWVSKCVLVETAWVLSAVYERDDLAIVRTVEMLLDHEAIVLEDAELVMRALAEARRRPAVEFPDCLMLESARQAGHLPFGTFDRSLARHPGAELLAARSAG
jgi:predicted nucleic-acid-binding protein